MVNPEPPARTTGICTVCGGPIRYWGRLAADETPRTSSIDDRDRWAHDHTEDWIHHPHQARPEAPAATPR